MESAAGPIFSALAQHGLPGIIMGLLVFWLWQKDKQIAAKDLELATERAARIADAKAYTDLALKLQDQAIGAVNKLTDVFEELKEMRERADRAPARR